MHASRLLLKEHMLILGRHAQLVLPKNIEVLQTCHSATAFHMMQETLTQVKGDLAASKKEVAAGQQRQMAAMKQLQASFGLLCPVALLLCILKPDYSSVMQSFVACICLHADTHVACKDISSSQCKNKLIGAFHADASSSPLVCSHFSDMSYYIWGSSNAV